VRKRADDIKNELAIWIFIDFLSWIPVNISWKRLDTKSNTKCNNHKYIELTTRKKIGYINIKTET